MADYKGLTIRIGGDTTGLQSALRAATSAGSKLQGQLTSINRAIRFDPSSIENVSTKVRVLGDRIEALHSRLSTLKTGMQQLSEQKSLSDPSMTIGELARQTDNAQLSAQRALERYNALDAQLEQMYRHVNEAAQAANPDVFGKFDIRKSGDIEQTLESLRQLGIVSDEDAQKILSMRDAWQQASDELADAKGVAQLESLGIEAQKVGSEIKGAATSLSQLRVPDALPSGMQGMISQVDELDKRFMSAQSELVRLGEALKLDPGNVDLTRQAMDELASMATTAQDKLVALESTAQAMDEAGFKAASDSMGDLGIETEKTQARLAEVEENIGRIRADIDGWENEQQKIAQSGDTEGDRYKELSDNIAKAKQELQGYVDEEQQLRSHQEDISKAGMWRDTQREIETTRASARGLNSDVTDISKGKKSIADVAEQYEDLGSQVRQTNDEVTSLSHARGLQNIGIALASTVTAPIVQVGRTSLDAAKDIDSAYRDMRKTVNGTEGQFEALRESAIKFSETHVTSADQMLSIQAIGGELGIAADALDTFSEVVSNIDIATDLDTEDAATGLGQLANIMNDLDESTMPNFADSLVRLGNNGASTESNIMDIAKRIGSMGSILGFTTPQILAWASSIASTGQNAESAGTAISKTMSDIETAVASGGDSLQGFADVAGQSAEDFANTWNTDPSAALEAFIKGLKGIEDSGGSADATLESLGITGTRQKQAIEGLMQTIGGLDDNLQMSQDAWQGISDEWGDAGDAAHEADAKAQGISGTLSKLQNVAKAFGDSIGESLTAPLQLVTGALQALYDLFEAMPGWAKTGISLAGGFVAALGPAILVISQIEQATARINGSSKVVSGIKNVVGGVKDLASAASLAKESGKSIISVIRDTGTELGGLPALLNPTTIGIVAVAAGVAALTTAFVDAQQKESEFRDQLKSFKDVTDDTVSLDSYSKKLKDVGDNASSSAMSVDELIDSNAKHIEAMQQTTQTAEDNIATLNTAEGIIEQLAGQTDLTADEQGKLKWAIDEVNQVFGTNYTLADAVSNSYEDQDGNVQNLKDHIYDLIEAKKKEIKVDALEDNLKEAYQAQSDAADTYAKAKKDYDEAIDKAMATGRYSSRTEAAGAIDGSIRENFNKADQLLDNATENVDKLEGELGDVEEQASDTADAFTQWASAADSATGGAFESILKEGGTSMSMITDDLRELNAQGLETLSPDQLEELASTYDGTMGSIIGLLDQYGIKCDDAVAAGARLEHSLDDMPGMRDYLQGLGIDVEDFSIKLGEAGVSSEQLNQIGSENIQALAQTFGGNVDAMVWAIQNYNNVPIVDKQGNVTMNDAQLMNAQGEIYTWNGSALVDQDGNIAIDQDDLKDAQGNVYEWNKDSNKLTPKSTTAEVDHGSLSDAINDANTWNNIGHLNSYSGTMTIARVYRDADGHAAGGYLVPSGIRKHAAGYIATAPTMLTSHDMVGEAGAEAIVPLTNRRYTAPFVGEIADQLTKLGAASGTTYNIYIDGTRLNDDDAIDSRIDAFVGDMIQYGVMIRG